MQSHPTQSRPMHGSKEICPGCTVLGVALSQMTLAKAKSGLVLVFQRPEMNEWGSFGLKRSAASAVDAQSARYTPSGLVVL